jgi:hypothetical protein
LSITCCERARSSPSRGERREYRRPGFLVPDAICIEIESEVVAVPGAQRGWILRSYEVSADPEHPLHLEIVSQSRAQSTESPVTSALVGLRGLQRRADLPRFLHDPAAGYRGQLGRQSNVRDAN